MLQVNVLIMYEVLDNSHLLTTSGFNNPLKYWNTYFMPISIWTIQYDYSMESNPIQNGVEALRVTDN